MKRALQSIFIAIAVLTLVGCSDQQEPVAQSEAQTEVVLPTDFVGLLQPTLEVAQETSVNPVEESTSTQEMTSFVIESQEDTVVKEEETLDEEAQKKAKEEAEKKAEEERDKLKEELRRELEEEAEKKEKEEAKRRQEEEEKKKAEEERKRAEEIAKQKEAEELKKKEEEALSKRSYSMLYYLAIVAQQIHDSKDNKLVLEDIFNSLYNNVNPGAVDEETQRQLDNVKNTIEAYIVNSRKRDRLQYLYNQEKAAAMRNAVPNPLAILSLTNAMDWKKLATNVAYTAISAYTNYKNASDSADKNFLMGGWELDDEELRIVMNQSKNQFNYTAEMCRKYGLDGMLTLSPREIEYYSNDICNTEDIPLRIQLLVQNEGTYKLLGNYWLELANCYFEESKYQECLECISKYNNLSSGIFTKDTYYARILPKAIVAAQNVYNGSKYVTEIGKFAKALEDNITDTDWAAKYFLAQTYIDLFAKTKNEEHLQKAYDIAKSNVAVLLKEQKNLNTTYLNEVEEITVQEPDTKGDTKEQKKKKEKEYEAEKKRVKEYNKAQKAKRATEVPSLYEPLILNCELLFSLAEKLAINKDEEEFLEKILQTKKNGIFLVKPINDFYSFSNKADYNIEISKGGIVIPADLLTAGSKINIEITENGNEEKLDDCIVSQVKRNGKTIDTFTASIKSKKWDDHKWTPDSKVKVEIIYEDAYDKKISLQYKVKEYESRWYWINDLVTFEKE